jgi:hypothetical protein
MLFMKADSTAEVTITTMMIRGSLAPTRTIIFRPITPATPVSVRPALSMNIAQTVMTAGLAKPATASFGDTRPVTASATSTIRATTSMRMRSLMNSTSDTTRMARTRPMSGVT